MCLLLLLLLMQKEQTPLLLSELNAARHGKAQQ
jgi:hypothetical protein